MDERIAEFRSLTYKIQKKLTDDCDTELIKFSEESSILLLDISKGCLTANHMVF